MRYCIYNIALSGDIHQQNFSFRSIWIFKSKIKILQKFICNKEKYFKAFKHSLLGVKPKNICVYSIHNVYYAFSYMATSIINCSIESITVLIEKEDQHIIPHLITLLQQKNNIYILQYAFVMYASTQKGNFVDLSVHIHKLTPGTKTLTTEMTCLGILN